MNETHDPELRSWVESANDPHSDFPIQNLPFGVFEPGVIGVAIGDQILNLRECARRGLLPASVREAVSAPLLNPLMGLPAGELTGLRRRLMELVRQGADREQVESALVAQGDVAMMVPVAIGDYTDFYASIHHAINVGRLFRPDNPLLPNYRWVPIAYHGRASSIVVSGTRVHRPSGQRKEPHANAPEFGPSKALDYEMEAGFFIGRGNALGEPIGVGEAGEHLFGMCIVNDWSARDIQAWEYQPLGPFLGKNFATTISPWVVTMEALEPYRAGRAGRGADDPEPLPYLDSENDRRRGALDVRLSASLWSREMRGQGTAAMELSSATIADLYWTPAQMIAHHTSNGCNLRTGDLIASGTVSGPGARERGSLIEITGRGAEPIALPTGEKRGFLEDGDEVTIRAWCTREGFARIGFGECRGALIHA